MVVYAIVWGLVLINWKKALDNWMFLMRNWQVFFDHYLIHRAEHCRKK
jgi:hypothetical protein